MFIVKVKQQTQGAIETSVKHRCAQGTLKITHQISKQEII